MDIHEQFIIKYDTLLLKNKRGCSKWIEKCVENLEKMWKNSIIQKYLPKLLQKFEELTDTRNQSYITSRMIMLWNAIISLSNLLILLDSY